MSLEERYGNLWFYYFYANTYANQLVAQRYMLPQDAARTVNQVLNDFVRTGDLPKRVELRSVD